MTSRQADAGSSPCYPDARCGVKWGSGWDSYKTHLFETCDSDVPHLITQVITTDEIVAVTESPSPSIKA